MTDATAVERRQVLDALHRDIAEIRRLIAELRNLHRELVVLSEECPAARSAATLH